MQEKTILIEELSKVVAPVAVLQVGISFAQIGLFSNQEIFAKKLFYLPQEPLGPALKKFWSEHQFPSQLLVCSNYVEKILDAKLGGSVAQVVTKGFEHWPYLSQPIDRKFFDHDAARMSPLAAQNLIFGIDERMTSTGAVEKAVDLNELAEIHEKMKAAKVERVCVNLLFGNRNSSHQKQVENYFKEQGYSVFTSENSAGTENEMPTWRRNIMNACLSGVFEEHFDEVKKSLSENENTPISWAHKNCITKSLFAWSHSIQNYLGSKNRFVLYLGLENWILIDTHKTSDHWSSPWGEISASHPQFSILSVQPTLEVSSSIWGGIEAKPIKLGYEPGPISFGRALKPTVYDFLKLKLDISLPQNQASGEKRLADHLGTLIKNIPDLREFNQKTLVNEICEQLCFQVNTDVEVSLSKSGSNLTTSSVLVTGFFAKALQPELSRQGGPLKYEIHQASDNVELHSIYQAMKENLS